MTRHAEGSGVVAATTGGAVAVAIVGSTADGGRTSEITRLWTTKLGTTGLENAESTSNVFMATSHRHHKRSTTLDASPKLLETAFVDSVMVVIMA